MARIQHRRRSIEDCKDLQLCNGFLSCRKRAQTWKGLNASKEHPTAATFDSGSTCLLNSSISKFTKGCSA